MYKIVEGEDSVGSKITQLNIDKTAMVCPFKASHPIMQPAPQNNIATRNARQTPMVFKGFINQPCDSTCPLFELRNKKVIIHCGGTPRTFELE